MNNINNLSGLDKAGLLFQMLGESLALTLFNDVSESDLLKIRIRSKELKNISVSIKKEVVEEKTEDASDEKEEDTTEEKKE